jgi:tetratricopeptide (TPR) repeat protein
MAKAKPQPTPQPTPKTPPPRAQAQSSASDPGVDAFTQGLAALQSKDWKKAVEQLEKAIELADLSELRDKARQLLVIPRQKAAEQAGTAKEPEADPFLTAVYEKNRGDLQAALEISRKGGRDQKDDRFAYLVASIHAVEDRIEEAVQALAKAVELNPKNRIHAFHDPDFAEIRKNRDYRPLFGLS